MSDYQETSLADELKDRCHLSINYQPFIPNLGSSSWAETSGYSVTSDIHLLIDWLVEFLDYQSCIYLASTRYSKVTLYYSCSSLKVPPAALLLGQHLHRLL